MLRLLFKINIIIFVNLFAFMSVWYILDLLFNNKNHMFLLLMLILSIISLIIIMYIQYNNFKKDLYKINNNINWKYAK